MADDGFPAYERLPEATAECVARLRRHTDPAVVNDVLRMQLWTEEFNRAGVLRLVDMILQWRGELFLEDALRDDVIGAFLTHYGVPPVS